MRIDWNRRKRALLAGALLLPISVAAQAQVATGEPSNTEPAATKPAEEDSEELREIIVTATKTGAQRLQSTPIAVSVVDSKLLEEQGLNTVQDIANYVPNLTFSRNTGQAVIYIRGIGSTNAGAGSDPSVTQQVNGVYIARATAQIGDFLDVDRIEVLRGPQGTLYGRNAVGGTINIISRQPSETLTGRVRVGYGNYNAKTAEAYLSGPLADTVTASIAGTYRDQDAFFDNVVPGAPDVGEVGRAGARAQLRYEPTAELDVTLRGDYSRIDENYESYDHLLAPLPFNAPLANALVGSYRDVALNEDQRNEVDTGGVSLDIDYRFGDGLGFKSITAFRKLRSEIFNDSDASDIRAQLLQVLEKQRQFTQEFNLSYAGDRLNAVAGLFFFGDRNSQTNNNNAGPSIATPAARAAIVQAAPVVHTRSYAAFAQANYEVVPDLRVILGIRYTTETKTFDQNFTRTSLNPATLGVSAPGFPIIFSAKRKDDAFTPKFGIDYQVTPDVFVYGSVTKGFKSGGFNNTANAAATAGFDPEKITAYEVGAKTQFLDRKLRVNLTGFSYDYSDLQVRQLIGIGNAVVSNAASARVRGFEIETLAKPISWVQFSANLSYLDAKYRRFTTASIANAYANLIPNQVVRNGVATFDASGNRLEATPKWSGVLGVDFTPNISDTYELNVHVDYTFRGSAFFDASNIPLSRQDSYGLLNANLGFGPETGWKIEAFIKNATNKKFYQVIAGNGTAPGAIVGDPRTFGVRLGYTF